MDNSGLERVSQLIGVKAIEPPCNFSLGTDNGSTWLFLYNR